MHAVISTWRLADNERFEQLADVLHDRLTEGGETHLPGHLAGYAVQTGPAELTLVNIYDGSVDADAASHALVLIALEVLDGRAELVGRKAGAAADLQGARFPGR